jgi:hypothetical protein
MPNIKLFGLLFCLFRFQRNTETLCFCIEANNQNKGFVSDSTETSFGTSFGCFDSKLFSFEGHPIRRSTLALGRKASGQVFHILRLLA